MKEYTVIYNVRATKIVKSNEEIDKDYFKKTLKDRFKGFDDVELLNLKLFEMEVPDGNK